MESTTTALNKGERVLSKLRQEEIIINKGRKDWIGQNIQLTPTVSNARNKNNHVRYSMERNTFKTNGGLLI